MKIILKLTVLCLAFVAVVLTVSISAGEKQGVSTAERTLSRQGEAMNIIFASYAESEEELRHVLIMVRSLRRFGGRFSDAPVWVFIPEDSTTIPSQLGAQFNSLEVEVMSSTSPEITHALYFNGKVYASGKAEQLAEERGINVLVWMDEDTIILQEPDAFALPDGVVFAYRPVMHNRSGTLWGQTPNEFWREVYRASNVDEKLLFPMITPGDNQKINTYFNAGLLVVRPELGMLRAWGEDFTRLCSDSTLRQMCKDNVTCRIFLHQTALVSAVLHRATKDKLIELPLTYNFPLFFHQQWDATREFDKIDDIITLRYDVYFRDPDPEWTTKLHGPKEQVDWIVEHLADEAKPRH